MKCSFRGLRSSESGTCVTCDGADQVEVSRTVFNDCQITVYSSSIHSAGLWLYRCGSQRLFRCCFYLVFGLSWPVVNGIEGQKKESIHRDCSFTLCPSDFQGKYQLIRISGTTGKAFLERSNFSSNFFSANQFTFIQSIEEGEIAYDLRANNVCGWFYDIGNSATFTLHHSNCINNSQKSSSAIFNPQSRTLNVEQSVFIENKYDKLKDGGGALNITGSLFFDNSFDSSVDEGTTSEKPFTHTQTYLSFWLCETNPEGPTEIFSERKYLKLWSGWIWVMIED